MNSRRKIRVLVVDDSLVYRELLSRGLSTDPDIEVIATAIDPFDARDKILELHPDVMTCDIEMPRMNGIEFIRRLLPQYPLPVIVISTISDAVFDAMNAGAVDFVAKPDMRKAADVGTFIEGLIEKVKVAKQAKVSQGASSPNDPIGKEPASSPQGKGIIGIGASTGGTEAIHFVLKSLPDTLPGIVIVQHIPPVFSRMFADRLNSSTAMTVKEAETGDLLLPGKVLIAPGDRHVRVKRRGEYYRVECFDGEKVNGHCPSVDVLFESIAKEAGEDAVGVILTGMGYDGARGLLAMKRSGATTIGQNQASSVVYGMPKAAHEVGAVQVQLPLHQIGAKLCALTLGAGKR